MKIFLIAKNMPVDIYLCSNYIAGKLLHTSPHDWFTSRAAQSDAALIRMKISSEICKTHQNAPADVRTGCRLCCIRDGIRCLPLVMYEF